MKRIVKPIALLMSGALAFNIGNAFAFAENTISSDGYNTKILTADEIFDEDSKSQYNGKTIILHSNDVHGELEGYAYIAGLEDKFADAGAEVIIADAGDFSQGSIYVSEYEGESAFTLMNEAGYDVATLGNHEFDYGYEKLLENLQSAKFNTICANVLKDGRSICDENYIYTSRSGLKVGFFGMDTPSTSTEVYLPFVQGLTFLSNSDEDKALYKCANQQVDELQKNDADIVIMLSHLGLIDSFKADGHRSIDVYENTEGIDMVLDGHSHTVMTEGLEGEPIQSTGTKFAYVGVVVIDDEKKQIEDHYLVSTENLNSENIIDKDVLNEAAAIEAEVADKYSERIGNSEVVINAEVASDKTGETNAGDLFTDAIMWKLKRDVMGQIDVNEDHVISLVNKNGIRGEIETGDFTKKDILELAPFGDIMEVVYITGEELLEALEAATISAPNPLGEYPQTKGIKFTIDATKEYDAGENYPDSTYNAPNSIQRVTIESINGQAFNPSDTYAIVTSDYLAEGGSSYYVFKKASKKLNTGISVADAIAEYIVDECNGVLTEEMYGNVRGDQVLITSENTSDQERISIENAEITGIKKSYDYTGDNITPMPTVMLSGKELQPYTDYDFKYESNVKVGKARITITGENDYTGKKSVTFNIRKGKTTFNAIASPKTIQASKLKNKKQISRIKVTGLSKGSSKPTFSIAGVSGGQKSKVTINKKNGKVTIGKGTKKCTIKIKVTSKANSNRRARVVLVKVSIA